MPITKRTETKLEVLPDGQVQQRLTTIVEEDGVELGRSHHRKVIDVDTDISGEDEMTQDICNGVRADPARVAARIAARNANNGNGN